MSGDPGIKNEVNPMKMIPIVRDPVALSLFLVGNGAVFEEAGSTDQWGSLWPDDFAP
jgi:hypothetical protein